MKSVKWMIAAVAAGALVPTAAAADNGLYAGLGYTNYDLEDFEGMGAVTARLGYRIGSYFGFEGELATNIVDGDFGGLDAEVDNAYGLFAVGYLPINERLDVFARVGHMSAELEATGSCGMGCVTTSTTEEEGTAYGIGLEYRFGERFGVRGDYAHAEGDFRDIDTIGASLTVRF